MDSTLRDLLERTHNPGAFNAWKHPAAPQEEAKSFDHGRMEAAAKRLSSIYKDLSRSKDDRVHFAGLVIEALAASLGGDDASPKHIKHATAKFIDSMKMTHTVRPGDRDDV